MQLLVVGGRSYVGASLLATAAARGISSVGFSSEGKNGCLPYESLKEMGTHRNQIVVVVATPAMHRVSPESSLNPQVLDFLTKNKSYLVAVSSIRVLDDDMSRINHPITGKSENLYANLNIQFEKFCLESKKTPYTILRLTNFLGLNPSRFENQSKLLPFSLINKDSHVNTITNHIVLKGDPSTSRSFVDSNDLLNAVITSWQHDLCGITHTYPGLTLTVGELANLAKRSIFDVTGQDVEIEIPNLETKCTTDSQNIYSKIRELGWKSNLTQLDVLNRMNSYVWEVARHAQR
jgi:nucleoside-diphosphate-sugar epimerase